MNKKEDIKDKTRRLVYYLITQKGRKESPLQILQELKEMTENDLINLSLKKEILNELINEESEHQLLKRLIEKNKKQAN